MTMVLGGIFFLLIGIMQFLPYILSRRAMKEPPRMKRKDEFHHVAMMPNYLDAVRCDRLRAIAFFCFIVLGTGAILTPLSDGDSLASHLLQVVLAIAMAPALAVAFLILFVAMPIVYFSGRPKWMVDPEWRELDGAAVRWWRARNARRDLWQ